MPPRKYPNPPRWIRRNNPREAAAWRAGVDLGFSGAPQPTHGELFMVVHAGWKAGKELREKNAKRRVER